MPNKLASRPWHRYERLLKLCRKRKFAEAYQATISPGLSPLFKFPGGDRDQTSELVGHQRATDLLIRARILLEFRDFSWAAALFGEAATELDRISAGGRPGLPDEPFREAAAWTAAAALASACRRAGLELENRQQLIEIIDRSSGVPRSWLDVTVAVSSDPYSSEVGDDPPKLTDLSVEEIGAWTRLLRNRIRFRPLDPDLREQAKLFTTEALRFLRSRNLTTADYDRVFNLGPPDKNLLLQMALLSRQEGRYFDVIDQLSGLVDARDNPEGVDAVALGTFLEARYFYRRGEHDKSLRHRIDRAATTLIGEGFEIRGSETSTLSVPRLDELMRDGADRGILIGHRQVASLWRRQASLEAEGDPSTAYELTVRADAYLGLCQHDSGWVDPSSVRTMARPDYLIRMGRLRSACSEVRKLLLGLGGHELEELFAIRIESAPMSYTAAEKRRDWTTIRALLCEAADDSDRVNRLVMAIVVAADVMRSVDRIAIALLWYDALSMVGSGVSDYATFGGFAGIQGDAAPPWLDSCGRGVLGGCRTKLSDSRRPCGEVPAPMRFLPLSRALSVRRHLRQAREGLYVALDVFGGELSAISDSNVLRLVPAEMLREIAAACLVQGDTTRAEQIYRILSQHDWEDAATAGFAGMIDLHRRRRQLAATRAVAARSEVAEFSDRGFATVQIAQMWAEIQIGDHSWALRQGKILCGAAPFDLGAWLGLARVQRLLGRHREAILLLEWLLGDVDERPEWLDRGLEPEVFFGRTLAMAAKDRQQGLAIRHRALLLAELGWCYIDIDRYTLAEPQFRAALRSEPRLVTAHRGLVNAYVTDPTQARAYVDEALELLRKVLPVGGAENGFRVWIDTVHCELLAELGRVYASYGADSEADAAFEKAQLLAVKLPSPERQVRLRILYTMFDSYVESRRIVRAEEVLTLLETSPLAVHGSASSELGTILRSRLDLAAGRSDRALERLNSLRHHHSHPNSTAIGPSLNPENVSLTYLVALYEHRDFEGVLAQLDGQPEVEAVSDRRRLLRGWTLMALSELPETSNPLEYVGSALAVLEGSEMTATSELHLRAMAEAQHVRMKQPRSSSGSLPAAMDYLDEAIARRPFDGTFHRDKAAIQMYVSQSSLTQHSLDRAARMLRIDARVSLLRGMLAYRGSDYVSAVQFFRQAAGLDPRDYVHHRAHVIANLKIGDTVAARQAVEFGLAHVQTDRRFSLMVLATDIALDEARGGLRPRRAGFVRARQYVDELEESTVPDLYRAQGKLRLARLEFLQGNRALANQALQEAGEIAPQLLKQRAARSSRLEARSRDMSGRKSPKPPSVSYQAGGELVRYAEKLDEALFQKGRKSFAERLMQPLPVGVLVLLLLAVYYGSTILLALNGNEFDSPPSALPIVVGAVVPFAAAAWHRLTSIRFQSAELELSPEPLGEIVHSDIDLSASRLVLIGGLSAYRPEVPFYEVEPRFLAQPT